MTISKIFRRIPRRAGILGASALMALGITLPATALAAPNLPATCDLSCVKNFGDLRIAQRITDLNALASHVTNYVNAGDISTAQAQVIQTDLTNNINGLTTLKGQLDSASNEQTARNDVKLIYTQFRIYAVVLPRDYNELHVDIELTVDQKLRALQPKIEQWIDSATQTEKQPLNALYSDYKGQLQEAEAMIDAAQGQYAVLTPQNFNNDTSSYRSAFQQLKSDEQTAHNDLHTAGTDLHKMAQIMKSNSSNSPSSATPTATSGA
jgi:hypothetical protein